MKSRISGTFPGNVLCLFFGFGMLFIPLTFYEVGFQYRLTSFLFGKPVSFIQQHFFEHAIHNIDFSSDTISLNILLGLLLVIAFTGTGILTLFRVNLSPVYTILKSVSAYYIAAILLKYGVEKIFKHQFYLPEPNILYSPLGYLTRDTLFWSTMGTSYFYSLAMGIIEVMAAVLLLVKKTRIAGYILAIILFMNIFLINIGFDISVKTLTLFLLAVVLFNTYPFAKKLYAFFIQHIPVQLTGKQPPATRTRIVFRILLSAGLLGFTFYPYISSGNFNDDNAARPTLHGAYHIEKVLLGNDSINIQDFPYKRFFIHRNNYLIFQQQDDTMIDYYFTIDTAKKQLEVRDYDNNAMLILYDVDTSGSGLQLTFGNTEKWVIHSKSLPWKTLPALQRNFHFTIDQIQ